MTRSFWRREARAAIQDAVRDLPDDTPLKERMRVVDAAYPFGPRQYHPYKMWLKERREYLAQFGYKPKSRAIHESPLERMMRRAKSRANK